MQHAVEIDCVKKVIILDCNWISCRIEGSDDPNKLWRVDCMYLGHLLVPSICKKRGG